MIKSNDVKEFEYRPRKIYLGIATLVVIALGVVFVLVESNSSSKNIIVLIGSWMTLLFGLVMLPFAILLLRSKLNKIFMYPDYLDFPQFERNKYLKVHFSEVVDFLPNYTNNTISGITLVLRSKKRVRIEADSFSRIAEFMLFAEELKARIVVHDIR
jgi:hypothetical protein